MPQELLTGDPRPNTRRALIVGKTGSGKTYLARKLMRQENRLIVLDPMGDWATVTQVVPSWKALAREVREPLFRVSLLPEEEEVLSNPIQFVDTLIAISRDRSVGNCTVVIDELSLYFDRGVKAPRSLQGAMRFGRRQGLSMVLISQRAMDCPIDIRSQLTDVFAFTSHEKADIEYLGNIIGNRDEAKRVVALPLHRHIHWDLTKNVVSDASRSEEKEECKPITVSGSSSQRS